MTIYTQINTKLTNTKHRIYRKSNMIENKRQLSSFIHKSSKNVQKYGIKLKSESSVHKKAKSLHQKPLLYQSNRSDRCNNNRLYPNNTTNRHKSAHSSQINLKIRLRKQDICSHLKSTGNKGKNISRLIAKTSQSFFKNQTIYQKQSTQSKFVCSSKNIPKLSKLTQKNKPIYDLNYDQKTGLSENIMEISKKRESTKQYINKQNQQKKQKLKQLIKKRQSNLSNINLDNLAPTRLSYTNHNSNQIPLNKKCDYQNFIQNYNSQQQNYNKNGIYNKQLVNSNGDSDTNLNNSDTNLNNSDTNLNNSDTNLNNSDTNLNNSDTNLNKQKKHNYNKGYEQEINLEQKNNEDGDQIKSKTEQKKPNRIEQLGDIKDQQIQQIILKKPTVNKNLENSSKPVKSKVQHKNLPQTNHISQYYQSISQKIQLYNYVGQTVSNTPKYLSYVKNQSIFWHLPSFLLYKHFYKLRTQIIDNVTTKKCPKNVQQQKLLQQFKKQNDEIKTSLVNLLKSTIKKCKKFITDANQNQYVRKYLNLDYSVDDYDNFMNATVQNYISAIKSLRQKKGSKNKQQHINYDKLISYEIQLMDAYLICRQMKLQAKQRQKINLKDYESVDCAQYYKKIRAQYRQSIK